MYELAKALGMIKLFWQNLCQDISEYRFIFIRCSNGIFLWWCFFSHIIYYNLLSMILGGQLLVHFWPFNALCASLKCAEERLQRIESTVFIYLLHRTIKDSWNTKHSCQKWSELRGLKFKLFFYFVIFSQKKPSKVCY